MGAPILWTPGKMRSFCRKNRVRKIPLFWGGFVLGGGGVPILFLWGARIFLIFSTHSDTQAVPAFHCIGMLKGIFRDAGIFKRADTLTDA